MTWRHGPKFKAAVRRGGGRQTAGSDDTDAAEFLQQRDSLRLQALTGAAFENSRNAGRAADRHSKISREAFLPAGDRDRLRFVRAAAREIGFRVAEYLALVANPRVAD